MPSSRRRRSWRASGTQTAVSHGCYVARKSALPRRFVAVSAALTPRHSGAAAATDETHSTLESGDTADKISAGRTGKHSLMFHMQSLEPLALARSQGEDLRRPVRGAKIGFV